MKKISQLILYSCFYFSSAFAVSPLPGEKLAKEQIFRFNIGSAPQSLDPHYLTGAPGGHVVSNIFEGLLRYAKDGKPELAAAQSYEHSDDFKTWTFRIRKDAKWSNGDPLTAQDFVYSFKRLANPKTAAPYSSYLEYVKIKNASEILANKISYEKLGVKALDDKTLQIELSQSVSFADLMLIFYALSPVPQKIIEKYGDDWTKPNNIVTNGAWTLDKNIINEKIVLKRNPYYWDNKNIILDKVVLYEINNDSSVLARYRAGDLDVSSGDSSGYPSELYEKVKKEFPNDIYKTTLSLTTYYYQFNLKKKPFDNPNIRRALNLALDRNIITDKILKVGAVPAYTFAPSIINGSEKTKNPDWALWSMKKRNEEAIRLLKDQGYSKSNPLKITLLYNTSDSHKKIAIAVSSIWKKNLSGLVDLKLENQEWKTFLDKKKNLQYEMARSAWGADYDEASSFLNILKSDSTNNDFGYLNKKYDSLIDKAYKAKTNDERAQDYADAEKILYDDSALIPIYFYANRPLIKPYVRGYVPNKNSRYYFKDIYILEK